MRRPGLLVVLVLGVLLTAGCTKPTPAVTIQSGRTTVRSEAIQYQRDGKPVISRSGAKALTVRPGDYLNISVDRETANAGWVVLLGGQKVSPLLINDQHAFSFQVPGFSGGSDATLAIFQQPPNGGPAAGSWLFTLREVF